MNDDREIQQRKAKRAVQYLVRLDLNNIVCMHLGFDFQKAKRLRTRRN